jgi:hypothetical protein
MHIEQRAITSIRPYENNPRHNDAAVDAVAASLQALGFRQPIVVDDDGVIVGHTRYKAAVKLRPPRSGLQDVPAIVGHTRYKAAVKLGLKTVPVHVATGLTAAQVKAYRIADNQTATLSSWDDDKLSLELAQLQTVDFDLNLTGFSSNELMHLLGSQENEGLTDPDAVPEPNVGNYPPVLKVTGLYFSQSIIWDKQHPVLTRKDYLLLSTRSGCNLPPSQANPSNRRADGRSCCTGPRSCSILKVWIRSRKLAPSSTKFQCHISPVSGGQRPDAVSGWQKSRSSPASAASNSRAGSRRAPHTPQLSGSVCCRRSHISA